MVHRFGSLLFLTAALGVPAFLGATPAAYGADSPTIEEILQATDDFSRGESSRGIMEMKVVTKRYERSVTMELWSKGTEHSLVRIMEPAKEKGVSTLKIEDNIWNYLPKVDRTIKVPASMMSGSWMGSHFSNDDLVQGSRLSEDFTATLAEEPAEDGSGTWTVDLVPHPDAPVVWGKVVVRVTAEMLPVATTYYDEDEALIRTMRFSDVQTLGGRTLPTRITVIPADAPEEYTEIRYRELTFDLEIPDTTFSLQALRK